MHEHLLSREDIIKAFGIKEFQKGLAYCMEGRIVSAMETDGTLCGRVQGTMDRPYDVEIDLSDLEESVCSCPVESMCKHCAALLIAYVDGSISSLNDIKEKIARLSEEEAKAMLVKVAMHNSDVARDIMRGPEACTWLGTKMAVVIKALRGCNEIEELSEDCETLRTMVEGVHSSDAPPREIMQLCFAVASEALDALDRVQGDPYEDLEGLVLCTMGLFDEAVRSLPDDTLDDALDTAMAFFGRDGDGIGLENMPLAFASRLGPDRILERFREEQRKKGPAAQGIRRIGMRYLGYCAHMVAGDTDRAVEALLSDGASEEDMVLAANTWALQRKWDKSRQVLESGIWMKNKRERAFLLLNTYMHQGPEADIPSAQNIIGLLRSIDGRVDQGKIGNILMMLRRTESDGILGDMIEREKLGVRMKVQLLADLGRWESVMREIGKVKIWDQYEIWNLASMASSRPDISTRLVLIALSISGEYMSLDHRATLAAAVKNMKEEDLVVLERSNLIKLGIAPLVATELAPRFPQKSMNLLKACLPDMDPQMLADMMSALSDKRMAAELGEAWLRRKLNVSPRYDRIRTVLTVMRCILSEEDWNRMKDTLLKEFPGRAALRNTFDEVESVAEFTGKIPPMIWNEKVSSRRRPKRS